MDVKTLVMDDLTVLRHITTNRCNICEKAVELMDQFLCYFIENIFSSMYGVTLRISKELTKLSS